MEDIIADQTEASATTKGTRKDQSQTPKTTEDLITDPIEARLLNSSEMFEDSVPQKHASVLSETVPRLGMYPKLSDPSTYWDGIQKEKEKALKAKRASFVDKKRQPALVRESLLKSSRVYSMDIPPSAARQARVESDPEYTENTPLLTAHSLPTVACDDWLEASSSHDDPNRAEAARSTWSEGGRGAVRNPRRRKQKRLRRQLSSEAILSRRRPFIATAFIPIATQVSIVSERQPHSSHRHASEPGYGTLRKVQESRQLRAPPTDGESSTEADEDEEEDGEASSSTADSESVRKASFASLTGREWVTIVMLSLANLCSTVAFSCIAPFFPAEAKLKGMTESQTGIVFGIFELVMFIVAPIFGKNMIRIGSKNMFTFGLGLTGVTAIAFGFLNFLPSGNIFFWTSLLIRVAEAIGDAAFVTSSFAISARCFPGRIGVVIGVMETFAGLGYTAGPLIGGFLYEKGGFQVPFLVLGSTLLLATVLSFYLIKAQDDEPVDKNAKGILEMLRIPHIWLLVSAIVSCSISLTFLDPTLAGHLEGFKLTPTLVGLMFLLCGGLYTVSAPFWGFLIDKFHRTDSLILFGAVATIVGMLLIGPAPFIPMEKELIVISISLAILGVAAGALYIPTFQGCLDVVKEHGYEDTFQTYGCVSGVFQSAFAFGGFLGPTLGGAMVQWMGFEWTTSAIAFLLGIFVFVFVIFHSWIHVSRLFCCCLKGTDSSLVAANNINGAIPTLQNNSGRETLLPSDSQYGPIST